MNQSGKSVKHMAVFCELAISWASIGFACAVGLVILQTLDDFPRWAASTLFYATIALAKLALGFAGLVVLARFRPTRFWLIATLGKSVLVILAMLAFAFTVVAGAFATLRQTGNEEAGGFAMGRE